MEPTTETAEITDETKAVFAALEARFGARMLASTFFRGELTFTLTPEDYVEVATFCRDDPALAFERLDCLLGNHYPKRSDAPFEVVLHLTSVSHTGRLRLKVPLAEGQKMPSSIRIWPSADWDERETWEMYGIEFDGNPDLLRLLLTEDFEGFPLRKDFPLRGTVGGKIRTDLKGKI